MGLVFMEPPGRQKPPCSGGIDGLSGAMSREQTARVFLQGYPQFPLDKGELPRDLDIYSLEVTGVRFQ